MDINLVKKNAIEAVKGAGGILMDNFDKEKKVSLKGKSDIVTDIDLLSEKFMIDLIKTNFPEHSILSEEAGFSKKESEYTWIMDPIDGTINYYHGMDQFCVALCLLEKGEALISAVYNPVKNHLYFAERGEGATLNGKVIKVSNNNLEDSVVMTHISSKKESRDRIIPHLEKIFSKTMHMRMFGSGISAMTCVANGNFDIFFNIKTNAWDFLPGALLVQEAGGKVTDIKGEKITIKSDSVLATNGVAHEEMLVLLKNI